MMLLLLVKNELMLKILLINEIIINNETKILVAIISVNSNQESDDGIQEQPFSEEARANLLEKMRQFDQKMKLDREKLELDKYKSREDIRLKEKSLNKKN